MIGIGITTKDRPDILEITLEGISRYLPKDYKIVISDDSQNDLNKEANLNACSRHLKTFNYLDNSSNRGVARNKNNCITALSGCDYLFLFDDDCFPIKDNWAEYIINCHLESGVHHFNLLDNTLHRITSETQYNGFTIQEHHMVGGVFMFLTKEVISRVGAFNKDYDVYGFEHASYTYRIFKSGLHNGLGINLTIGDLQDYIFSFDYSQFAHNKNHARFCELPIRNKFSSSMPKAEANASISFNQAIMNQDCNGPIYREF